MITASNGRKVPALTIFTYALQYFKDHALRELSDQSGTRFVNEDVRWVITVPAIWKQSAKQFMREAAYQVYMKLIIAQKKGKRTLYLRLVLLQESSPNNYLLRWNPKQHRYTYASFDCISLFPMKLNHIPVIQSNMNMLLYHRPFPINHHPFISILINVSI